MTSALSESCQAVPLSTSLYNTRSSREMSKYILIIKANPIQFVIVREFNSRHLQKNILIRTIIPKGIYDLP